MPGGNLIQHGWDGPVQIEVPSHAQVETTEYFRLHLPV
jgi:hypothetical protein